MLIEGVIEGSKRLLRHIDNNQMNYFVIHFVIDMILIFIAEVVLVYK